MRGDGGNHHEKLGLKTILCASQFTIPNTAGMSPNPVCNITDTMSSYPNQASLTPDFSYPLVSSTSFSSSSPVALDLVHNSTIIAEHKVQSSLSISPCDDHELTPSTAYTEYYIHCVLASSHDRLSPAPSQSLISRQTMLYSILYISTITSYTMNRVSAPVAPPSRTTASRLTAPKYYCNLARSWPPSASPNSLDHSLQVYL